MLCLSSKWVNCVAFKPDNPNILVSGSDDETIIVWDITSGSCLSTLRCDSGVLSVAYSADGTKLAAGLGNPSRSVVVFDTQTNEQICSLTGHTDMVTGVCFDPTGKTIVSCSSDKTIRFWDSATGAAIGSPVRGHRYAPSLSKECFLSLG